jgi:protein gp37
MANDSSIEWTDSTWNPWRGCDKVSPGCAHCYMFAGQQRFGRDPSTVVRASPGSFNAPLRSGRWAATRDARLEQTGRHLVFTCSWSDWFHPDADPWRDEAWDIVRQTPQSTYQILTKRPERILDHLPADWGDGWPNVWLGVSIENRRFVERADLLRAAPAAVRFISAEPLLGPLIHDADYLTNGADLTPQEGGDPPDYETCWKDGHDGPDLDLNEIDWLIVGGESGPGHRLIAPDWVRALRDVCPGYRTAFFLKQWGGPRPGGKAVLDGRVWNDFPAVVMS